MGGLSLFAERLPLVADTIRQEVTPTVKAVASFSRECLGRMKSEQESEVVQASLRALLSIGQTMTPGENGVMADAVPAILKAADVSAHALYALSALSPLP